jgi:hypothetical protein
MPLEIESATNLNLDQIQEMVPGAIEAMQGTRDNYELLRLGVAAERLDIGRVTVGDAYRC